MFYRTSASSFPSFPPTAGEARIKDLEGAIARGSLPIVQWSLTNSGSQIPSDTLLELLEQACRNKQCPLSIKKLLLAELPHTDAQTDNQRALQLAVEHDDIPFAQLLLAKGVNPNTAGPLFTQNPSMRMLLQFARRKAILYPGAPQPNETKLDKALREWRTGDASQLLAMECPQLNEVGELSDIWRDAVRDDRVDIQRALLLLGYVDSQVRYRLKEDDMAAITDPGVKKVMKEIPYYSPKRGQPKYFNFEGAFIDCRHFVADQLGEKALATNPDAKSNFDHYQTLEEINGHVCADDKAYRCLKAHATESHLIDIGKFGQFLVQQFEAMERKGESTKLMLMTSTNHAMELSLRIKVKEDGTKVYVVKFFDPNLTTTHARSASTDLQAIALQDLRGYIDGNALLKDYFPERKGLAMFHVHPGQDELQAMASLPQGAAAGRKLESCIPAKEIDATAVWQLMDNGFAADLRRLKEEIARRPEAERITLLAAKNADKTPGLFMAIQDGHADVVKAFGELIRSLALPKEACVKLLAAKDTDGTSALFMALQNGDADAVTAFGELMLSLNLTKEQCVDLLAAQGADGTPGIFMALQYGHADAVKAYGELIRSLDLPKEKCAELLAAKTANGTPALFLALQNGHADAVKEYEKLLPLISEEERAELLADTVTAFKYLLPWISNEQCEALLAATDANGNPVLWLNSQEPHADEIYLSEELLPWIPEEQRAGLLATTTADGTPALSMALLNGLAAAVNMFAELRSWVTDEQLAELREAAIKAFEELLPLIAEEHRATLRDAAIATLEELR
jgi:ankyrin repeat protein